MLYTISKELIKEAIDVGSWLTIYPFDRLGVRLWNMAMHVFQQKSRMSSGRSLRYRFVANHVFDIIVIAVRHKPLHLYHLYGIFYNMDVVEMRVSMYWQLATNLYN